jgi:hypothetical protein
MLYVSYIISLQQLDQPFTHVILARMRAEPRVKYDAGAILLFLQVHVSRQCHEQARDMQREVQHMECSVRY